MDDPRRTEIELPQPREDAPEPSTAEQTANEAGWLLAQDDEDSGFVRAYN